MRIAHRQQPGTAKGPLPSNQSEKQARGGIKTKALSILNIRSRRLRLTAKAKVCHPGDRQDLSSPQCSRRGCKAWHLQLQHHLPAHSAFGGNSAGTQTHSLGEQQWS